MNIVMDVATELQELVRLVPEPYDWRDDPDAQLRGYDPETETLTLWILNGYYQPAVSTKEQDACTMLAYFVAMWKHLQAAPFVGQEHIEQYSAEGFLLLR